MKSLLLVCFYAGVCGGFGLQAQVASPQPASPDARAPMPLPTEPVPKVAPSAEGPLKTEKIRQWSGVRGGSGTATTKVITDQKEWAALSKTHTADLPNLLQTDLEMGVLIELGERPGGGHQVRIVSAVEKGGRHIVQYEEVKPAPDAITTQALTTPWVIGVIPRSKVLTEFRKVRAGGKTGK